MDKQSNLLYSFNMKEAVIVGEEKKKRKLILTPQQEAFLSVYTDPKSETFGNAYQSALKAGYSDEYAQNMTGQLPAWLSENISDMKRLRKAEENLDMAMEIKTELGDTGFHSEKLLKIKVDTSKFIAETLGKRKYSKKIDIGVGDFSTKDLEEYS